MVEKEEATGGVFVFQIGLGTFSGYMSSLVASEAEPLSHVSVSFFERHSVHGPDVFHCVRVMVGGWSVLQFIL